MHRVELKVGKCYNDRYSTNMFLMHRVELKVRLPFSLGKTKGVPNAPCGVESMEDYLQFSAGKFVPNAPCGVESKERIRK